MSIIQVGCSRCRIVCHTSTVRSFVYRRTTALYCTVVHTVVLSAGPSSRVISRVRDMMYDVRHGRVCMEKCEQNNADKQCVGRSHLDEGTSGPRNKSSV